MKFQEIKKWQLFEKQKFFLSFSPISFELRNIFSISLRQKMRNIQKNQLMYSLIGFEYFLVLQTRYLFIFSQKF